MSLFLVACSQSKTREKESTKPKVEKVTKVDESKKKVSTISENELAETFVKTLFVQQYDLDNIDKRISYLENNVDESSLSKYEIIENLENYRLLVDNWLANKELNTSSTVSLVESTIKESQIYQNDEGYFVNLILEEKSPTINGAYEVKKQLTFAVKDGKITNLVLLEN